LKLRRGKASRKGVTDRRHGEASRSLRFSVTIFLDASP
jgi:hypothetical protein